MFAAAYRSIFLESLVVLDDPELSGDAIIDAVASAVPPGAEARILGVQNIKGTGLDFVYRWVSIDMVVRAIRHLESPSREHRERALTELLVHDDYGMIDAALARDAIDRACARYPDPSLPYEAARDRVSAVAAERLGRLNSRHAPAFEDRVRKLVGETLDFADAVRRRRLSARVVDALAKGQISHATAAIRMRRIVARMKGAWMRRSDGLGSRDT
jgi:hypothetical protein